MQLSGMLEKMLAGEAHLTTPIKANTNLPFVFLSVNAALKTCCNPCSDEVDGWPSIEAPATALPASFR